MSTNLINNWNSLARLRWVAEHFIIKFLKCIQLLNLDFCLSIVFDKRVINCILMFFFIRFFKFFIKKGLKNLLSDYFYAKFGQIKTYFFNIDFFNIIFFVFLFFIAFWYIRLTGYLIYADTYLPNNNNAALPVLPVSVYLNVNDIDIEVFGNFVNKTYYQFGDRQAYFKSIGIAITIMKFAFQPDNFVPTPLGNSEPVFIRGYLLRRGNYLAGRRPFKVAYELKKNPLINSNDFESWSIKLQEISHPADYPYKPNNMEITSNVAGWGIDLERADFQPYALSRFRKNISMTQWENLSGQTRAADNWIQVFLN